MQNAAAITSAVTLTTPVSWVADQLAQVPAKAGRRVVVLVGAERQAHAIRRHVCVDRARSDLLAGILFTRPVEFARVLLLRAGAVRLAGWEGVRRLRLLQLFEASALRGELRYFNAEQLRAGEGYADAFARTIADLESSGLDPALAGRIGERLSQRDPLGAARLHDVAAAWEMADRDVTTMATTAQMLREATAVLAGRPQLAASFGPIFALLTASPSTVLLRFLRLLPGLHAVFQEARPLRRGAQRWRAFLQLGAAAGGAPDARSVSVSPAGGAGPGSARELQLVQRFVFEVPEVLTDPARPRSRGPDGSLDVEAYPNVEDEIEAAAIWVTEQIAGGTPLERISLVVPEIDPYAPLLADRLARTISTAGAVPPPVYVAGGLSLADSPAGLRWQALLHALAHGLDAETTIRVLPALRRGEHGAEDGPPRLSPSRAAAVVYGAGIVGGSSGDPGGVHEWVPRLTRRRDVLQQMLADADAGDEQEERRHVISRQEAQRWLRDIEPILPAISALQRLAEEIVTGVPLDRIWARLRSFGARWLRIPADPPQLLTILDQLLQPVLRDTVARAVTGPAAIRLLIDVLRQARRSTTRFGEPAVFIGTPAQAAGLPFAAVRILGLAEGGLPHTPHDDPIVPNELRASIEDTARCLQADICVPGLADRVLDEMHDVFRAIAGAEQCLALSAPRQWLDRSEREVSGIMLEIATALGRTTGKRSEEGDVPTAARLRAAYFAPGQEARRRYAGAHPLSPRTVFTVVSQPDAARLRVPAAWVQGGALALDRVRHLAAALEGDALGGMDGVITDAWGAAQPPGLLPRRPISASALTKLLGCPHRFLLERILHLSEPAAAPPTDVIEPIAYGSLFHSAAERFFRENGPALCRREGTLERWSGRAREIAAEEFEALRDEYPLRGADSIARERRRLLLQIEQLVRLEWEAPAREFVASELVFGEPAPVRLTLDGDDLYVRGAIDRIDRIAGALSVRDLKTGRIRDFGEERLNAGRDLQIGLYVLALEASAAAGARVSSAAYVHPSAAQEPERVFEGSELDLLRRRTREWLDLGRRLLSSGSFPRTPDATDCAYCPFVPACGHGAQQHSAAKLERLPSDHLLRVFLRFKQQGAEDA